MYTDVSYINQFKQEEGFTLLLPSEDQTKQMYHCTQKKIKQTVKQNQRTFVLKLPHLKLRIYVPGLMFKYYIFLCSSRYFFTYSLWWI